VKKQATETLPFFIKNSEIILLYRAILMKEPLINLLSRKAAFGGKDFQMKKKPVKKVAKKPAKKVAKKPVKKVAKKIAKKPAKKVYHISHRPDGGWQVTFPGSEKALKLFKTQAEAIDYAEGVAKNQGSSISIHSKKGAIRKK
jgi:hypothetical protein